MPEAKRLTLCMIVRDEAANLGRCLKSVQGLTDEIIVVDTGSVDDTKLIARAAGAHVYDYMWTGDFSAARNFSLDKATGDWILVLDADDAVTDEDRQRIRPLMERADVDGFFFTTVSYVGDRPGENRLVSPNIRLFRNAPDHRYRGAIHEIVLGQPGKKLGYADIKILHYGYLNAEIKERDKIKRNLAILQAMPAANQLEPFNQFNLGTEYLRSGKYMKAVGAFKRALQRIEAEAGWAPELYKKLAFCYAKLRKYGAAFTALNKGIARYPGYTDLLFLKGCYAQETGRLEDARVCFEQCLRWGEAPPCYPSDAGSGNAKALLALGNIRQQERNYTEAITAYRKCLESDKCITPAVYPLVECLAAYYGRENALAYLEKEGLLLPERLLVFVQAFISQGLYPEGEHLLARADNPPSFLKGVCAQALGRHREAENEFGRVGQADDFYPPALLHRVLGAWHSERYEAAAVSLTALQKCPGWSRKSRVLERLAAFIQETDRKPVAVASASTAEWDILKSLLEKLLELDWRHLMVKCLDFILLSDLTPARAEAVVLILWKYRLFREAGRFLSCLDPARLGKYGATTVAGCLANGEIGAALRLYRQTAANSRPVGLVLAMAAALVGRAGKLERGELS